MSRGNRTPVDEKLRQIKFAETIFARKTEQYKSKIATLEAELAELLKEESNKQS